MIRRILGLTAGVTLWFCVDPNIAEIAAVFTSVTVLGLLAFHAPVGPDKEIP